MAKPITSYGEFWRSGMPNSILTIVNNSGYFTKYMLYLNDTPTRMTTAENDTYLSIFNSAATTNYGLSKLNSPKKPIGTEEKIQ